jgi:hypothetical protein
MVSTLVRARVSATSRRAGRRVELTLGGLWKFLRCAALRQLSVCRLPGTTNLRVRGEMTGSFRIRTD